MFFSNPYLKAADARGLLPMFFLELTTGMRKSELAALKWTDVDWKEQTISVNKQAYVMDGKLTAVPPKTVNSVRKIALSEETLAILKKQRKADEGSQPGSPYIFPSPVTGEMYHPDSVVNLHKKILKEAGLEHIRFHDLRRRLAGNGPLLSLRDISPASPGELPSRRWPYRKVSM